MNQSARSSDEKVVITWNNVTFETLIKDPINSKPLHTVYKKKLVLDGLSGKAESKQLLAILGPTGCGKTSLMNVLAARFPSGGSSMSRLSGVITVNGQARNEEEFRKISAYVMQDDNLYAYLTVFETLMLSAHFYLPNSYTHDDKVALVNAKIAELGLVKATETIIGSEKIRGVSGGERKRVSIAVQLLSDPAVLFLDEPTSGLDSFQSLAVMEAMKNLASSGRLVISVIHQPRSSIYEMFDQLLVLSEGRTMYFGDAQQAVTYFSKQGHACPEAFNPSDYFLDILSPDNRTKELEEETKSRIGTLGNVWKENEKGITYETVTEVFHSVRMIGNDFGWEKTVRNLMILFWRNGVQQLRDIPTLMSRLIPSLIFGLLIGGIYSNIGDDQESVQNRKGVLYFMIVNAGFITVNTVTSTFPAEKLVVARERTVQAYSTFAYCCAKVLVEMPLNLIPMLLYSVIAGKLIGLNPDTFGYFLLIMMMFAMVIVALGLAISAFAPSADAANAMSAPFLVIGILFGGFYIQVDEIPIILNWFPYISSFRWAFEALCINEFKGLTFTCNSNPSECILTGEEALATLTFDGHTTNYGVFGLGMLWICYLVALYFLLVVNEVKYLPVGHTGRTFLSKEGVEKETTTGGSAKEVAGHVEDAADVDESRRYAKVSQQQEAISSSAQRGAIASKNNSDARFMEY